MTHSSDDELQDRLRRDPRRDPTDPPPPPSDARAPVVQVIDTTQARRPDTSPASGEPRDLAGASTIQPTTVRAPDPRLAAIEQAIEKGHWDKVLAALGPQEEAARLPPNFAILYAIASKETETAAPSVSEGNQLAIRSAAALLELEPSSPVALMVAKRLLRKNPIAWRKRPAPRPTVSLLIAVFGIAIFSVLSWLISFRYIQFHLPVP